MGQSRNTRAIFTGSVRGNTIRDGLARGNVAGVNQVRFHESLRCIHATSAKQLASAQRFWMHRYREAGLQSFDHHPAGFESLRIPGVATSGLGPVSEVSFWRPTTFLAFRFDGRGVRSRDHGNGLKRSSGEVVPGDQICGTVTLLSPRELGHVGHGGTPAIGRITRLAVDHKPFGTAVTATGYRTIFLEMTSCMHRVALQMGLTHLDAIVHPRHAKLYRRVFGAEPIGETFSFEQVGGSPGQYMRADITQPSHFHARLRDRYEAKAAS